MGQHSMRALLDSLELGAHVSSGRRWAWEASQHACWRVYRACALQVREEEIEAAHREQVQRRSAGLLASKANKFAAIHTERLKTFRQLAAAKVGYGLLLPTCKPPGQWVAAPLAMTIKHTCRDCNTLSTLLLPAGIAWQRC